MGRFLQKYDKNATICRAKYSDRKRKSTKREDRKIIRSVKRNRAISANAIRLKECGFNSCFTLKKNFVSEKNRKMRLDWAKKYVNWTSEQ